MSTRRKLLALLCAAAFAAGAGSTLAAETERIQLAQMEKMFANMRVQTKWNVDGPLLWGYFFFDPSKAKLNKAAQELKRSGYRVVGIDRVTGKQILRLQVQKVEMHTPATLDKRNAEFYALAKKYAIASYDGMDVGPVPAAAK